PASGASGSPITLKALSAPGQPVVVDGADDFSNSALWVKYSGNVWLAASVTWSPFQVFANGARLTASTVAPGSMPAGTFQYVAGTGLYVNAGGSNPATQLAQVGHRPYGFYVGGKAFVVIDGFEVVRAEDRGIMITNVSSNIEVVRNFVHFSYRMGIQAIGCTAVRIASNLVADNSHHGISLTSGTTGSTIEDNESCRNLLPGTRVANGLYMFGAPGNLIRRNRFHDNQDTGEHFQTGSNDNISIQNISWNNGDHGYDHYAATGNIHVNDIAYGNHMDGFSFEGDSPGNQLFNSIAVENGLTTDEFDLWVDGSSDSGFVSNDNIFWNSTIQVPVKYILTKYANVADYVAVSGQDTRSIQADPKFVSPATANFHLMTGSPAIDNANSAAPNWPAFDIDGNTPMDAPSAPNVGLGPVAFADRGAFEFQADLTNLVLNPSFESDMSGWAPVTDTLSRVAGGHDGAYSLKMKVKSGQTVLGVNDSPDWVQSSPAANTRYRFVAWARADVAGKWYFKITEYIPGKKNVKTTTKYVLTTGWKSLTYDYVTRWKGSKIDFQILGDTFGTVKAFQVDDISIRIVTPALAARAGLADEESGDEVEAASVADAGGVLFSGIAPNPMRMEAQLAFTTSRPGAVSVHIFDVSGRLVRTLADGAVTSAGRHLFKLDGRRDDGGPIGDGLYFYQVRTAEGQKVGRFVVVK
ncbi:MAG TPA: right-handed parallel beta-helix repeat-containing protein, partial [Candidatus Eisenbacteria bacterium]